MKRLAKIVMTLGLSAALLAGCGTASQPTPEEEKAGQVTEITGTMETAEIAEETEKTAVRIGSLKGPTTIGLLKLMQDAAQDETALAYSFTMATQADELTGMLVKGDLDIARIPANLAANLYWKNSTQLQILDVNTLGVLYVVSADDTIQNVADLKGRTVCLTGKGTSPDIVLQYLLEANGVGSDEVTLEYKSEAAEVAALLAADQQDKPAVGVLPQPFVTAACAQNDKLQIVLDLTEEWEAVQQDGSSLVTGVTVATKTFVEEHPEAVEAFLQEQRASVDYVNENVEQAAVWAVEQGIIAKEPIAQKAIPACNVVCITRAEMKQALTGYFRTLYEANPKVVGEPAASPEDAVWDALYYGAEQ